MDICLISIVDSAVLNVQLYSDVSSFKTKSQNISQQTDLYRTNNVLKNPDLDKNRQDKERFLIFSQTGSSEYFAVRLYRISILSIHIIVHRLIFSLRSDL